jgi:hypothetical protein
VISSFFFELSMHYSLGFSAKMFTFISLLLCLAIVCAQIETPAVPTEVLKDRAKQKTLVEESTACDNAVRISIVTVSPGVVI